MARDYLEAAVRDEQERKKKEEEDYIMKLRVNRNLRRRAALCIQREYRCHVDRILERIQKLKATEKSAVLSIEIWYQHSLEYRRKQQEWREFKRRERHHASSIVIQRAWRRRVLMRVEKRRRMEILGARLIAQVYSRYRRKRQEVDSVSRARMENQHACQIQKVFRGYLGRRRFRVELARQRQLVCSNCGSAEVGGRYCKQCGHGGRLMEVGVLERQQFSKKKSFVKSKFDVTSSYAHLPHTYMSRHHARALSLFYY